uniref:Titin n=1 Tax=Steinernema glaseri TaxID=37863 RepID=A0A1I7Z308_9BILA
MEAFPGRDTRGSRWSLPWEDDWPRDWKRRWSSEWSVDEFPRDRRGSSPPRPRRETLAEPVEEVRPTELKWHPVPRRKRKNLPPYIGPIYSHQIAIPAVSEDVLMQPAIPQKKEKGRRFVPKKAAKENDAPPLPFVVRKVPDRSQNVPYLSQS